jgi:hypothetical protein
MPTIRITRQTVAQRRNVRVGDVFDVTEAEARQLIGSKKAELATGATPQAATAAKQPKHNQTRKAKP